LDAKNGSKKLPFMFKNKPKKWNELDFGKTQKYGQKRNKEGGGKWVM